MNFTPRRRHFALLATVCGVLAIAGLTHIARSNPNLKSTKLFLAPMIGVIETCILLQEPSVGARTDGVTKTCTGPQGSAAALVESTLSALAVPSSLHRYQLGYTLQVPLLKLFRPSGDGWVLDNVAVERLVRTIRDTDRPAIVYLFSTHFGVNAPIERALEADTRNLSETQKGPLLHDRYYSVDIFNWTFASTETAITRRRLEAAKAVIAGICKLEPRHIAKLKGVTLLGELHHVFPGFERGMGFNAPYLVSDYSEPSKRGFREFLKTRYDSIEQLNQALGTEWTSFDQVNPPSKDIRTMPLRNFSEHIDSFAHGSLPITGWAFARQGTSKVAQMVRIYRNGELIARTPVHLGRQDVLEALPELGEANTGWRFDMDFKLLPAGLHRIDVYLEDGTGPPIHLSTRRVSIMNRLQQTPRPMPMKPLPASRPAGQNFKANVDMPVDRSSYFYNPLVPHWHAYRGLQVASYLKFFSKVVKDSCLSQTPIYTHQIVPFTNPSWDENKYAIDASLGKLEGLRLGVSLYGEPTYGTSFANWLATSGHVSYGITEFHPMKGLSPADLDTMLKMHVGQGAEFVSFFLEPRWKGNLVARGHNIFSLDPDNKRFGSDVLYRTFREAIESRQ